MGKAGHSRDISVNHLRTQKTLRYLYDRARATGQLDQIVAESEVGLAAIRKSVREGAVSTSVASAFSRAMGIDIACITGVVEFYPNVCRTIDAADIRDKDLISDELLLEILITALKTKDIPGSYRKRDTIAKIKRIVMIEL